MKKYILFLITFLTVQFCYSQINKGTHFVPEWAKDAIYYQIFPERFSNGDSTNDPPNVEMWDGEPKINNYFGGDLKGIIDHLDYIRDLGFNAIYLNPIFESNTNHKYHTIDYFKIDPHFGDDDIFKQLIDESHKRNIRVVIDAVFNHTGTEFFAFKDIVKNEKNSNYLKWYDVHSFPVNLPPSKPNYEAWWGIGELPKLMADNPDVRKYLFDATRHWMKLGLDGWRLDVPNEMSHDFWIQWRKLVKQENPDALIIGEIWDDASAWLKGDEFDAVMNYRFRGACVGFIALENRNAFQFDSILAATRNDYPAEVADALQNLIGSHDTERFLTLCSNDISKMKLAMLIQMTYTGAPMVYYGDEIGITGLKDPDCRKTMVWDSTKWNTDIKNWLRKLVKIRNDYKVFKRGSVKSLISDAENKLFGFEREYENSKAVVILNMNDVAQNISTPKLLGYDRDWVDLLNNTRITTEVDENKQLMIYARSGIILISNESK